MRYTAFLLCLMLVLFGATAFFHSQHYQWQGDAPGITGSGTQKLGKMNTINDFCTNPLASWIGEAINSDGNVISDSTLPVWAMPAGSKSISRT